MNSSPVTLPASGYIRQAELIGVRPVTEEQAAGNRGLNRRVVRPRPGKPGMIPMSSATLWRAVKAGKFPAPIKLSERVTAWELAAVVAWLRARSA